MSLSVIIAAGGSGTRFTAPVQTKAKHHSSKRPTKLFLELAGQPLLASVVEKFRNMKGASEVLVVVPKAELALLRDWKKQYRWKDVIIVQGGKTRAESVLNGLRKTSSKTQWVMVHDGARPFTDMKLVNKMVGKTSQKSFEAGILAKKVVPTIKKVSNRNVAVATLNREKLYEAETPQLIRKDLLRKAYQEKGALNATDESSLLEAIDVQVKVIGHSGWNPKITTYDDYQLALAKLKLDVGEEGSDMSKIGFGTDFHRLVSGRKLVIGGIKVPFSKGALGHSDGDALLHAIADAILGALGLGDIGEWFSDKDPKNKGLNSAVIIKKIMKKVDDGGWCVGNVDSVVHLEEPKLGPYKNKMKKNIAQLLNITEESVSVKAKTSEKAGVVGAGNGIACQAIVTIRKRND